MRSSPIVGMVHVAGEGPLAVSEGVNEAVEAGRGDNDGNCNRMKKGVKAALLPEPRSSQPRGACALTAGVEITTPATAR